MDESLIQDFLTESGELVERLDGELLELESAEDPADLLNSIFRALHTIKGAASFLSLPTVTSFAHVAEFALDKLRKGEAQVNEHVIDCLLRSVDVVRSQLEQIESGSQPKAGPDDLIAQLEAIAAGADAVAAEAEAAVAGAGASDGSSEEGPDAGEPAIAVPHAGSATPLELTPEKKDVLPFMVDDLLEAAAKLRDACEGLAGGDSECTASAEAAADVCESVEATAEYYDLAFVKEFVGVLSRLAAATPKLEGRARLDARLRVASGALVLEDAAEVLRQAASPEWPIDVFHKRAEALIAGEPSEDDLVDETETDPAAVLRSDGLWPADDQGAAAPDAAGASPSASQSDVSEPTPGPASAAASGPTSSDSAPASSGPPAASKKPDAKSSGDQTIRVEVARLEALLNLVGEMTLTKNQVLGVSRELREQDVPQEFVEKVTAISSDLDRLTAELQVGVMRTRMQPLDKLFGRYPRIIRDLAKATGKKVNLEIVGGETEVDKSVLELLGDPLVHMLRNSVDHGLEGPADRAAAGKPEVGVVVLSAEHQGGHVRIAIEDDGRGICRQRIGAKAVEKGLATEETVAAMSDEEVFQFIFAAGFSTADQVSDLSGRGVGMDVVRTNISALNGVVGVRSTLGAGTTIEILIPLTVAIMPAMMVGIRDADYAIPLSSIEEIVRYVPGETDSVRGRPVMRLRERVLPLVDMRSKLDHSCEGGEAGFSVIVGVGQEKAGLIVDRLIGQQEVVIKPLDDEFTTGGPFSGATIREDGDVSLILDVVKLLRCHESTEAAAAA
jgi:two-component system chemotaxis sensor kinase CheA